MLAREQSMGTLTDQGAAADHVSQLSRDARRRTRDF